MLPAPHRLLCKLGMRVNTRAHDHQLDVLVREEVICGAVVLRIRVVDGAVLALLDSRLVLGRFSTLQEGVDFEIRVG